MLRVPMMAVLVLSMTAAGCGTARTGSERRGIETRVGALATLYYRFQAENSGYAPNNETEFREFVETQDWILDYAKVDSHDALFTSESDNQPIVICLGKQKREINGRRMICHEATAVEGKRLIGLADGEAIFIDDSVFAASEKN